MNESSIKTPDFANPASDHHLHLDLRANHQDFWQSPRTGCGPASAHGAGSHDLFGKECCHAPCPCVNLQPDWPSDDRNRIAIHIKPHYEYLLLRASICRICWQINRFTLENKKILRVA